MEQVIAKLSEIEITARRIMEDADRTKQALSEETEQACREYDTSLEQEISEKVDQIRADLEKDKEAELRALRQSTEQTSASLDVFFEKNHEQLSKELFDKILSR
jgi:F0F1-type ATP synthase membrane subunit b/b'